MIKNILIPTDGSLLSRRAAKDAVELAQKLGAKVTGFYVAPAFHIEVYDDMVYMPPDLLNPKAHAANAKKAAERYLEFIKKMAADRSVPYEGYFVMNDSPSDAIVKAARKYKCDLIYMGSHGRTGITKLLLGSQTNKVLTHTRIPVLVHR